MDSKNINSIFIDYVNHLFSFCLASSLVFIFPLKESSNPFCTFSTKE